MEGQGESRTAAGTVGNLDIPGMDFGNPRNNGEPQAGAFTAIAIGTPESAEDVFPVFLRNAGADIADRDTPIRLHLDLDTGMCRRVRDGIVHQIADRAKDHGGVTLSGSNGSAASALGALFGPGNGFWNVGAGLLQPLFDGGALLAKKRAADAALQQVEAQYQSAVVMAFQNTADALEAAQFDAKALSTIVAQERAAKISLSRSGRQRELGDVGLPSLLLAQQAYQQAEISLAQAKASQLADTVGLFTALGGGWWHGEKEGEGYK